MPYIYKITNIKNNKIYVGFTSNDITTRFKEHWASRSCSNAPLHKDMSIYSIEDFKVETIEEIDISMWDEREEYWIKKLNSFVPNGYNVCNGGKCKPPIKYGEDNNKSKLTQDQVDDLIKDLLEYKLTFGQISKKYCVSQCTIERINKGISWKRDNIDYPIRKEKLDNYIIKRIIEDLMDNKLTQYEIEKKYNIKSRTRLYNINIGAVGSWLVPNVNYPIRNDIENRNPLYLFENL